MHRLVRLLVIIAGMSVAGIRVPFAAAAAPGPSANGAAQASNLRELYEQGPSRSRGDVKVGRLMVQLIQQGTPRRVGIGRVFSSGDTFRFEVSSNRSGWLYVLHRSPGGQPQLLWPRPDNDRPDAYLDANEVEAYQSYLIPPPPGVFEFDAEVGKEQFYVVIRSQPRTPELSAVWPGPGAVSPVPEPSPVQSTPQSSQKIVQFSVRGGSGSAEGPMRGVVFVPGGEDGDPNVYFASEAADDSGDVLYEFRLQHGY